jgi:hypothetical protein
LEQKKYKVSKNQNNESLANLGTPTWESWDKRPLSIGSTYRHIVYDREEVGGLLPNMNYVNVMNPRQLPKIGYVLH